MVCVVCLVEISRQSWFTYQAACQTSACRRAVHCWRNRWRAGVKGFMKTKRASGAHKRSVVVVCWQRCTDVLTRGFLQRGMSLDDAVSLSASKKPDLHICMVLCGWSTHNNKQQTNTHQPELALQTLNGSVRSWEAFKCLIMLMNIQVCLYLFIFDDDRLSDGKENAS